MIDLRVFRGSDDLVAACGGPGFVDLRAVVGQTTPGIATDAVEALGDLVLTVGGNAKTMGLFVEWSLYI